MTKTSPQINQVLCQVRQVHYNLPTSPCDRCQRPAESFATTERTAIDVNLEYPVLLLVTVSVHYCPSCDHYFRAQPPFLRPKAIYTNRVVDKAVQSVYEDGMAMRRVTARMARDFWVQPSEGIIRHWCPAYGDQFDFAPTDESGQEIRSEHKGTDTVPVTPGQISISGLNFTWTVGENWSGFYAVLNHWPPVETQDLGCANGLCERDDWIIVEFH